MKKNSGKKSSTKSAELPENMPSRGSDGRPYITVYVKDEQLKRLKKYCAEREIGVGTFLRTAALEKVIATDAAAGK